MFEGQYFHHPILKQKHSKPQSSVPPPACPPKFQGGFWGLPGTSWISLFKKEKSKKKKKRRVLALIFNCACVYRTHRQNAFHSERITDSISFQKKDFLSKLFERYKMKGAVTSKGGCQVTRLLTAPLKIKRNNPKCSESVGTHMQLHRWINYRSVIPGHSRRRKRPL